MIIKGTYLIENPKPFREGLRICGHRGNSEVRSALIRYARWLRKYYDFPIRVPVYLYPTPTIVTISGSVASASFFAPSSRKVEPYIRIATGDYRELKKLRGRDNALAANIHSLRHEVVHYFQWLETGEIWERGVVQKAKSMLSRYAKTVDYP